MTDLAKVAAAAMIIPAAAIPFLKKDGSKDMAIYGPMTYYKGVTTASAADVTAGYLLHFKTPNSPQDGRTKGTVTIKEWQIVHAEVILNGQSTWGIRRGALINICMVTTDPSITPSLARGFQDNHRHIRINTPINVPYGLMAIAHAGAFQSGDTLTFSVIYREVIQP